MTKQDIMKSLEKEGIETKKSWTKEKLMIVVTNAISQCHTAISQHEKHNNSYFWTPPSSASSRRWKEKQETFDVKIGHFLYESHVSCSCRNYYYTGTFSENGKKKNLRCFKALLGRLETIN